MKKARHFAELAYQYALDKIEETGSVFEMISLNFYGKEDPKESFSCFTIYKSFKSEENGTQAIEFHHYFSVDDTEESLQSGLEDAIKFVNDNL